MNEAECLMKNYGDRGSVLSVEAVGRGGKHPPLILSLSA